MNNPQKWLTDFGVDGKCDVVDGLVSVKGYVKANRSADEVAIMEKADYYGADAVFFEASHDGKPPVAQALIYKSGGPENKSDFAELHKRLWSWGGVPLVYRFTPGLVELFRCAHRPDFDRSGKTDYRPFAELRLTLQVASDPWWNAELLRTGALWDDPSTCKQLLSSKQSAQKTLINAVHELYQDLNDEGILPKSLRRRLLILSILIAYLEKRGVFEEDFFSSFLPNAKEFFQVLADGPALVKLLDRLEERFNGHVFVLGDEDRERLRTSRQLTRFADLIEGRQEPNGQRTLWQRYSFADLPVELISHVYQLFVNDSATAVYTPHCVVKLLLSEVLSWDLLDRLEKNDEVILDPACGSGIFLVESYKRLVLHWRSRNDWKRPRQTILKRLLTKRLRGVDVEEGAVELAAFSLCLALCDSLEPMEIRTSVKLFPSLKEKSIHTGCFFESIENKMFKEKIGVIVGNPPFASTLDTEGAHGAYERYQQEYGALPDKQIAYLFLHESMKLLTPGGVLSMLQQYNFLYNQQSVEFRRKFFENWDVREILDFISVRGLFQKGGADTKVIIVVAESRIPPPDRRILHATFRRSGRASAEQGFDIDYYDMHWLSRELILNNDTVWRSDLLGGGRVVGFVNRLQKFRTLAEYAREMGWDYGEGYIEGAHGTPRPASHIVGKALLPSGAIDDTGINASKITIAPKRPIECPRSETRFTPPMILIHEQFNLHHDIWTKNYLTYKNQIVGFCAQKTDSDRLFTLADYLFREKKVLRAFVAATSVKLFTQHATTLSGADVFELPYPNSGELILSLHERILVDDIVDYYRDLIRLGEDSTAMQNSGITALPMFNDVFTTRINGVYKKNKLRALEAYTWPEVICQPYIFGKGKINWSGADELKEKLDSLLQEKRGAGLNITRIARLYDDACIYLIKPNRLRYWLRSIALRDADETLADLMKQGF